MQFRDLKKQYQVLKKPMDEAISKVLEAVKLYQRRPRWQSWRKRWPHMWE